MNCPRFTRVMVLTAVLAVSACSTTSKVEPVGAPRAAASAACKVKVVKQGDPMPAQLELVGTIETHINRNIFLGGGINLDDAMPELRAKTCALGGDTVRIDDMIQSSAAENRHIHVWASVFKQ